MSLSARLHAIHKQIIDAEIKFARSKHSVQLLLASKAQPASAIREAYHCGERAFGENYCQEALKKQRELTDLAIEWHFIGPIQSNKTRAISEHFSWVHSVDSFKVARRLSEQRPTSLPPLNICIQVNVSGEQSKSGVSLAELALLCDKVSQLKHLKLRGLMTLPKSISDELAQRDPFKQLRLAYLALKDTFALDTLSMGMSNDFPAAIAEGATHIRVGRAIFGERT